MSFRTAYGYNWSENGWRMCNRDECGIVDIPELYLVDTAPIRLGAPLTILGAWLFWYDRNVEEIVSPVWGWSRENLVATSNHLSGTAVDVNAPQYPWGYRTMPQHLKNKVREGLELFEGTVFWGADWNRADEMHYQMALPAGSDKNVEFAERLRNGYLGIYGPDNTATEEGLTVSEADRIIGFIEAYVGPLISDTKDNRAQLCGSRDLVITESGEIDLEASWPGWAQLNGNTVVDALAEIGQELGLQGYGKQ